MSNCLKFLLISSGEGRSIVTHSWKAGSLIQRLWEVYAIVCTHTMANWCWNLSLLLELTQASPNVMSKSSRILSWNSVTKDKATGSSHSQKQNGYKYLLLCIKLHTRYIGRVDLICRCFKQVRNVHCMSTTPLWRMHTELPEQPLRNGQSASECHQITCLSPDHKHKSKSKTSGMTKYTYMYMYRVCVNMQTCICE